MGVNSDECCVCLAYEVEVSAQNWHWFSNRFHQSPFTHMPLTLPLTPPTQAESHGRATCCLLLVGATPLEKSFTMKKLTTDGRREYDIHFFVLIQTLVLLKYKKKCNMKLNSVQSKQTF